MEECMTQLVNEWIFAALNRTLHIESVVLKDPNEGSSQR